MSKIFDHIATIWIFFSLKDIFITKLAQFVPQQLVKSKIFSHLIPIPNLLLQLYRSNESLRSKSDRRVFSEG